jgi:hypothetical protein
MSAVRQARQDRNSDAKALEKQLQDGEKPTAERQGQVVDLSELLRFQKNRKVR